MSASCGAVEWSAVYCNPDWPPSTAVTAPLILNSQTNNHRNYQTFFIFYQLSTEPTKAKIFLKCQNLEREVKYFRCIRTVCWTERMRLPVSGQLGEASGYKVE